MKTFALASFCLALVATVLAATTTATAGVEEPSSSPVANSPVVQGCYSSAGSLVFNATLTWNSKGSCGTDTCLAGGFKTAGTTQGRECYCGNTYPPESTLVDDSQCNTQCAGYGQQACGGANTWTIYNTGLDLVVESDDSVSSSSLSSATQRATAVVTISGSTVIITASSAASSGAANSPNVAGIAAGVVVGVVALAAIIGAAFFVLRKRRNREIEEEYRRNAAVNAFINGSKPPGSSGGTSVSDARLDPVMAQRRMSSGSIADNQDYTRKILRVTNA